MPRIHNISYYYFKHNIRKQPLLSFQIYENSNCGLNTTATSKTKKKTVKKILWNAVVSAEDNENFISRAEVQQ